MCGVYKIISMGMLWAGSVIGSIAYASSNTPPQMILEAIQHLRPGMSQCPTRVWSQNSWDQAAILFVGPDEQSSHVWLWDVKADRLETIEKSKVPQNGLNSHYSFFEFNGYKVTSVNTRYFQSSINVAELAVHEAFHYVVQRSWKSSGGGSRSTVYPVSPYPRLFRKLMQDQMLKYFENSDEVHLSNAKHWFERWQKSAPTEVSNYSDNAEGSAKYAEILSLEIGQRGCMASDAELLSGTLARINQYPLDGKKLSKMDSESYVIGATSLLAAKKMGWLDQKWETEVSNRKSPLNLLFELLDAKNKIYPRPTGAVFTKMAIEANKNIKPHLDPIVHAYTNKDYVRVSVPWGWLDGSFSVNGFYYLNQIQKEMTLIFETRFQSGSPNEYVLFKENSGLINKDIGDKCDSWNVVLVEKNQIISKAPGSFEINAPSMEAKFRGKFEVNAQGFQYLCVIE